MPSPPLLDRRLLIVTGKGGVGKSSVAAALALAAARRGQRALVCEVNAARERVAPLLGASPAGAEIRQAAPGVWTVNVQPEAAMREYGMMVLHVRALYEAVFENRLVRYFLRMVPSLSELVTLGKILHEARAEEQGRPRWDQVIVDAPATGHAIQLLRTPAALLDTVPPGPLRRDAEWMRDLLVDPERAGILLVTLPEELPVSETIELEQQIREELHIPRQALLVNAFPEARFGEDERRSLSAAEVAPPPLGPAAQAAGMLSWHAERAAIQLARVRAAIDLPVAPLPLLATERWDAAAVGALSRALEGARWAR